METEKILERLALLRGMTAEQAAVYQPMAQDAAARLEAHRAQPGGETLLEAAAAALVNWMLTLNEPEGGFTAGDVRVESSAARRGARQLWRETLAAAAPYLHDEAFAFRSVS